MKVSLDWLSDYVRIDRPAEEVAEILSDVGLPYEGIEYVSGDAVIDIEVTSNRGDCLGHIGTARELAAATGAELKLPKVKLAKSDKDVRELAGVQIDEPELCGRYTARVIEGIKVGPSPDWMRKRLEAVGLRSVNNVVDASNYAMMETGQPPHAFDYAKIAQGKIIVRKALPGERITSIDGTKCDLGSDMLVIADAQGPVAIAGVMGGLDTEVSDSTTAILLEDAYFDPVSVRTTSRRLALPSEAAFRFERKVDIEAIDWASQRTAQLIVQAAGGVVAKGLADVYPGRSEQKTVTMRLSRLRRLLGIEIPPEETMRILKALAFGPRRDGNVITCSVPSWRSDVYREVDLIEEVARVYGYGKVHTEKKIYIEARPVDSREKLINAVATFLNGCGFYETISTGFVDDTAAELLAGRSRDKHLSVKDETRKSVNLLRQNLIGSVLAILKSNINVGNRPCRIFELANTFVPAGRAGQLPTERTKLALACDGELQYLRGVIEGILKVVNRSAEVVFRPTDLPWAEVAAQIVTAGKVIGCAGMASQQTVKKFNLRDVVPCVAQLDFEMLSELGKTEIKMKPIPRFPAISRDLSIVVDEQIRWSQIAEAVASEAPAELEELGFVGIYRGAGVEQGRKSITISLRFRDEDGTLTHETVDGSEKKILDELENRLRAKLRAI